MEAAARTEDSVVTTTHTKLSGKVLYAVLLSVILGTVLLAGKVMVEANADTSTLDITKYLHAAGSYIATGSGALHTALYYLVPLVVALLCAVFSRSIGMVVYKGRYVIAAALLALGTAFKVSGSSLAQWGLSLPGQMSTGMQWGMPRSYRTDEWALFTPMALAQTLDPQGQFPYFGEVFRGTSTDMFIVYGQPVRDIAMIFRPSQWGYLLFGFERGLAFYWCLRFIALFMVTFELGMVLTKKSKALSAALAALVTFAPVVQWWFSINCFVEMIVFGELIVLCLLHFFKTDRVLVKIVLCVVLIISAGGFALTLYPAWEFPMAYLIAALLIGVLIAERKELKFRPRKDVPIIAGGLIILAALLGYVMLRSKDAISALSNTAYPGSRVGTGGGGALIAFRYPISFFLPFITDASSLATGVQDSLTMFFDLFPLGIILAIIVMIRRRKLDAILVALLVPTIIIGAYCFVGFPEWLAKLTLLGHSITARAMVIFSLLNLLILFRAVALMEKKVNAAVAAVAAIVFAGLVTWGTHAEESQFVTVLIALIIAVILAVLAYCFIRGNKGAIAVASCVVAVVCGLAVNPLQLGAAPMTSNPLVTEIRSIVKEDPDAKWIAAVGWQSNVTTLAGAKTVNATNTYPNRDLWKVLDPDSSHETEWNRYAHLHTSVASGATSFTLAAQDTIDLDISVEDLYKLDVKYVVTNDDASRQNLTANGSYKLVKDVDGYGIYAMVSH